MPTRFERQIKRKSPELQKIILAVREAIPHVRSDYDREEALPSYFDGLLGPEKTSRGITVSEALRHIHDILTAPGEKAPQVIAAAALIRRELHGE